MYKLTFVFNKYLSKINIFCLFLIKDSFVKNSICSKYKFNYDYINIISVYLCIVTAIYPDYLLLENICKIKIENEVTLYIIKSIFYYFAIVFDA